MDIQSELDVYKFLQLINDNNKSDEGTVLFVEHLFAIGKLEYVKLLFNGAFIVRHNVDIPYLVALEKQLEAFAEAFDMFIREDSNKEKSEEPARDVEAEIKRLIQELEYIATANISSDNLSNAYQSVVPHLLTAIKCFDKIRAFKYKSGIDTNIKNAKQFFQQLQDIEFVRHSGLHFSF